MGQVSIPEQNVIVKELAGPSQHLLPATSKTASGSRPPSLFVLMTPAMCSAMQNYWP
jgi:hypothetical protein